MVFKCIDCEKINKDDCFRVIRPKKDKQWREDCWKCGGFNLIAVDRHARNKRRRDEIAMKTKQGKQAVTPSQSLMAENMCLKNINAELLEALKYAVSILDSIPEIELERLQENILDESINWKRFVDVIAKAEGR